MRSDVQGLGLAAWFSSLGMALLAAALSLLSSPVQAQSYTLPPAEKVPTFLGIDLPLRPGERLVSLGKSGCSVVVFAPRPEHYEFHLREWGKWEWSGACRFGLIHGNGQLYYPPNPNIFSERRAIYGSWYDPAQYHLAYFNKSLTLYKGSAYNDINTKWIDLSVFDFSTNDYEESIERIEKISSNYFGIGFREFDNAGVARNVNVIALNVGELCRTDNADIFKPFAGGVKSACSRQPAGQFVIFRQQSSSLDSHGSPYASGPSPVVWLKACPLKKGTDQADCPALLRSAIGKDYAEFEAVIAASPVARPAMVKEIFDRYAPLEAAVEARLKQQASAGGAPR